MISGPQVFLDHVCSAIVPDVLLRNMFGHVWTRSLEHEVAVGNPGLIQEHHDRSAAASIAGLVRMAAGSMVASTNKAVSNLTRQN